MERLGRRLAISLGLWRDGFALFDSLAKCEEEKSDPYPLSPSLPPSAYHSSHTYQWPQLLPIASSFAPVSFPTNLFQHGYLFQEPGPLFRW